MTWIRVDCELPNHPVIGLLAQELHIDTDKALACYSRTLLGFGAHRADGLASAVTDVTLEEWAKWRGRAGRWAAAFRSLCLEQRAGEKDEPGTIKGWWRNLGPLREQERNRNRPGQGTRRATEEKPGAPSVPSRGNGNGNGDEYGNETKTTATTARENDVVDYARRCTVACNKGLRANPKTPTFRELAASNEMEYTQEWAQAGIPVDFAEQFVYERASTFPARGSNRQPVALNYFTRALREAWDREQGRQMETGFQPKPRADTEELDEYERVARKLEAEAREAHRAG